MGTRGHILLPPFYANLFGTRQHILLLLRQYKHTLARRDEDDRDKTGRERERIKEKREEKKARTRNTDARDKH
jgi:hypothetical protein